MVSHFERKRRPDVCVTENYIRNFIPVTIPIVSSKVETLLFWYSLFLKQIKKLPPPLLPETVACKLVKLVHIKQFKMKLLTVPTKLSQIRISLSLLSILCITTDTCFGQIVPLMFFMFGVQQEWTWSISDNYISKSDVCIKLKYIRMLLITVLIT